MDSISVKRDEKLCHVIDGQTQEDCFPLQGPINDVY